MVFINERNVFHTYSYASGPSQHYPQRHYLQSPDRDRHNAPGETCHKTEIATTRWHRIHDTPILIDGQYLGCLCVTADMSSTNLKLQGWAEVRPSLCTLEESLAGPMTRWKWSQAWEDGRCRIALHCGYTVLYGCDLMSINRSFPFKSSL